MLVIWILSWLFISGVAWGGTLNVPSDQPTIQSGIYVATDGDTVLIADGTYTGPGNYNINFNGKAITVKSVNGPDSCIIDCQQWGREFLFYSGEVGTSVQEGLTIKKVKQALTGVGCLFGELFYGFSNISLVSHLKEKLLCGKYCW